MTERRTSPKPALTHASFDNSYRLACAKSEDEGIGYAVAATGDPTRPFTVALTNDDDPNQIVRFMRSILR